MNKEDKICAFCKYHFIEGISFDSPQSCCKKRMATTEKWLNCDDFEYSDSYIESLQKELYQLETNIAEASNFLVDNSDINEETGELFDFNKPEELFKILERGIK